MSQNTSDINTCTPAKINTQKYQKFPCDFIYIIQIIYQSKTYMTKTSIILTGSSTVTEKLCSGKQDEHNSEA